MVFAQSLSESSKRLLFNAAPKRIVLSGPSGYLGRRVLHNILEMHELRRNQGLRPGKVVLLSASPGNLMNRLYKTYGGQWMDRMAASRVDYYTQHSKEDWIDHLGSLGLEGENSVFVNCAGLAGPKGDRGYEAMMDVNYRAAISAAKACQELGFGHWVQTSTQATKAERAGQVPYSKAKAMADFALYRLQTIPVSIACLGMLYNKQDGNIGQDSGMINLKDLALLPITPILGDGSAPLQPQEVNDAALRLAFLAATDTDTRPSSAVGIHFRREMARTASPIECGDHRFYDAVGPETLSMLELLTKFARFQGNTSFRPVHIDYRNMERIVNLVSLGNLNRQFISLLRSEQDAANPVIGNPDSWEAVLGPDSPKLATLEAAMDGMARTPATAEHRTFPYGTVLRLVWDNPKLISPGLALNAEIFAAFCKGKGKGKG